jgi:hypothetical protein
MLGDYGMEHVGGVAVTPEEMRAKSIECEEKGKTGTPELRNMYSVLAREWRRMADEAEGATEGPSGSRN